MGPPRCSPRRADDQPPRRGGRQALRLRHLAEIADAIQAARSIKVDRKKIRLEEPIRETGTYMVEVEVGGGTTASVKTIVAEAKE